MRIEAWVFLTRRNIITLGVSRSMFLFSVHTCLEDKILKALLLCGIGGREKGEM